MSLESSTQAEQLSVWGTKAELRARVGRPQTSWSPSEILLVAVPRRFFCFGSLVILDMVCRYLSLFLFKYKNRLNKMLIVRLAGDHLYRK